MAKIADTATEHDDALADTLHRTHPADHRAVRDRFRADHIGIIFQLFNLIPYLSVLENVCLPCAFSPRRFR